ncbi:MAG TPA: cytochrome P450 [Solirubrobacteraceae bacterium]|nr:cytochrome P450 [Solirubrobacteraceae bacterium]
MTDSLPPGPRTPVLLQTLANWSRPTSFIERARARYGRRFTVRMLGQPPMVMVSDPEEIKQVLTAPPDVLHPGEGAFILEPVVGPNSVILLDEDPHLRQRKLLLPAFHGERMQALYGLMEELTRKELESWPTGEEVELHPRFQRLTLEIILRAVFGLERGAQLAELRALLTELLTFSENPLSLLPPLPGVLARVGPPARMRKVGERVDELIYELIDERRAAPEEGADVLALLLSARDEDGNPMSPQELRDELVTALVAGHETTASQLAWTFVALARAPRVQARLRAEIDALAKPGAAGAGEDYLNATITEAMRLHPVIPNAEPRHVKQPFEAGGVTYPPGVTIFVSAYLVHHDPDVYPEPYAFRPERFLESGPGTYTWLPFGGGRRRCLGAAFAQQEMRIVVREMLTRYEVSALRGGGERTRRRSITFSPARGARVMLTARAAAASDAQAREARALAAAA